MNPRRFHRLLRWLLALALIGCAAFSQQRLNRARSDLGLTRIEPLENAPPVLAFTTVALGGFRGLIANALWIRAMDMQDAGKYFEMAQLAEWITKLEPHIPAIWIVQAWNMAYNISIKFPSPRDRWFWVSEGIRLLRDEGLRYNPKETLIYRELAWFFQHKMGQNLDDAHLYFKQAWATEMNRLLGGPAPDFAALINPATPEAIETSRQMREAYRLDPAVMQEVDRKYGPLDWRLPEAHAIYWAWLGLARAKPEELITLRRVIYQSLQLAFHRGRLLESATGRLDFGPNIEMVDNANRAYEDMLEQDPEFRDNIQNAHRNFLRDAVYFLYAHNRISEAARWFQYVGQKYPNRQLLDRTNSLPGQITLEDYALDRLAEDAGETSRDRIRSLLEGLVLSSYLDFAAGFDDRAQNSQLLARKVFSRYQQQTASQEQRVGMVSLEEISRDVRSQLLGTNSVLEAEMQARLRTRLNLPAPSAAPAATNNPAAPPIAPAPPR
ncbi:MAG TPA: hypothetical protein P5555_12845 [Candidatus Paceibacterota bacterium]|nr:hypothetical protein [Verrucomicrobiota bacterium]HOX02240.1 hypothetical protein [Verrucomicrobiota bacterium]HRZ46070.1 hypothetical protein [Candidatus Paceibacterota bacterium]